MDRTRRLSEELLQTYPEAFGTDFDKNKEALVEMAIIPSKQLRNRIAGYIAKTRKQGGAEEPLESAPEQKE